jgi:hypothetical protein
MIKIKKAKNPTDEEFLKKIRIEKFDNGVFIRYEVIYEGQEIAVFILKVDKNYIEDVEIFSDEFKRRGLATYVYNYIEKDLKIKLQPSKAQTKDGKLFWQHRTKKTSPKINNPTDYSFLRLLKIEKRKLEFSNDNIMYKYLVKLRGKTIAYAEIFENANYVDDVQIYEEKYRRKGLATYLYDYIEHDLRRKLVPSPIQLTDGEKFWKNRNLLKLK